MPQPRSMSSALSPWGDLTEEKKRNAEHNAREAQLDREEEERGFFRSPARIARRQSMPGFLVPIAGPAEQAAMAAGMAGQTMDNIQRENDSRVSQRREMRRMAHEQELMRMKMQGEAARANADREAMLIRELLSGM